MHLAIEERVVADSEATHQRLKHRGILHGRRRVGHHGGRGALLVDGCGRVHAYEDVGLVLRQANEGEIDRHDVARRLLELGNRLLTAKQGAQGCTADI